MKPLLILFLLKSYARINIFKEKESMEILQIRGLIKNI